MKWLNRTPTPPAQEPPLNSRSITIEAVAAGSRESGIPIPAGDESDLTQKSAVPDEIKGEPATAAAPAPGPTRRNPDRHHCPTLASPIPAILAESMSLAEEDPAPGPGADPVTRIIPERR